MNREYYDKILFWNFGPFNRKTFFIFNAFLIIFFHVIAGVLQERVFTHNILRKHGILLSSMLLFFNFSFSLTEIILRHKFNINTLRTHYVNIALLGVLISGSIGLSNLSFKYLNYTAQLMFKCCKPVMVMLGTIFVHRRWVSCKKILTCFLMTLGVLWFSSVDAKNSPNFDIKGIYIILCALIIDAISPNLHEKFLADFQLTTLESISYPSFVGSITLIIVDILIGDFKEASSNLKKDPYMPIIFIFFQAFFVYLGTYRVVLIIQHFSAIESSLITNFRKMISVSVSFIIFDKPFSIQHLFSAMLVFMGCFIDSFDEKSLYNFNNKIFGLFSNSNDKKKIETV